MKTQSHIIEDLLILEPHVYYDHRGENCETFNEEEFETILEDNDLEKIKFSIDSFSFSKKDVLRGFHGDRSTWKLVQCLQGSIQLVVIDIRDKDRDKHRHQTFFINDKNRTQILIPAGCVNAHLCLSDTCIFGYKLSGRYYGPDEQLHVKWNDDFYNVFWPVDKLIMSQRDA